MNEAVFEKTWPSFRERAERLEEAIKIMKLLWSENFVTFRGKYYKLRKANLYTKPSSMVPIYVAAFGRKAAEIAGRYADGLLTTTLTTTADSEAQFRDVLLPAFEKSAKAAGRNPNEIIKAFEVHLSYDEDYDKALKAARFWAGASLPAMFKYAVTDPREVEEHGNMVGDELIAQSWAVGTNPEDYIKQLERYVKMGFQHLYYVSGSPDEIKTIRMYGKHVIPYIKSTYG